MFMYSLYLSQNHWETTQIRATKSQVLSDIFSSTELNLIVLTEAPQRSLIRNNRARDTDTMDIILTFILILYDVSP